jgi:hypothetical protein
MLDKQVTDTTPTAPTLRPPRPTDSDIAQWKGQLLREPWPPAPLRAVDRRQWDRRVADALDLGLDEDRIMIPTRDHQGDLCGVLRYAGAAGVRTEVMDGSRPALFPHPALHPCDWYALTDDPASAIAARSRGLPAIAIPPAATWEPEWSDAFVDAELTVVMIDADYADALAATIRTNLGQVARTLVTAEVGCGRPLGYDLTHWLDDHPHTTAVGLNELLHP